MPTDPNKTSRPLSMGARLGKRIRRLCETAYCRNMARDKRRFCNTCRCRKYEKPLRRKFRNLKRSARDRGILFSLTFQHFERISIAGGHDKNSGSLWGNDTTIDRIDSKKGYEDGNIQILTRSENSEKSWIERTGWVPQYKQKSLRKPQPREERNW